MSDDLVRRVDSLMVLLNMEREKSLSLGKHIEKLEAALQAVIRYAGNAGDDYLADKSRNALEGKDDVAG